LSWYERLASERRFEGEKRNSLAVDSVEKDCWCGEKIKRGGGKTRQAYKGMEQHSRKGLNGADSERKEKKLRVAGLKGLLGK